MMQRWVIQHKTEVMLIVLVNMCAILKLSFFIVICLQADLWSVGAILFQLVTGKPPFDGNSQLQVFWEIIDNLYIKDYKVLINIERM